MYIRTCTCLHKPIHKAKNWCIQVAQEVLSIAALDSGTISTALCNLVDGSHN